MAAKVTKGHRKFREWKRTSGKSNQEIADLLGVGPSQVSRWDTTTARPDVQQMARLTSIGISLDDWMTNEEAKALSKLPPLAMPEEEAAAEPAPTFQADDSPSNGGASAA